MGKQSRRKRQRDKRNHHLKKQEHQQLIAQQTLGIATAADTTDSNNSSNSSNLLKKLRHGDARIRHGALAALTATILDPEALSSSKNNNKSATTNIAPSILQAIRERVMDTDLETSQAAAGCLANYILFRNKDDNDDDETKFWEMTASWTAVLTQRLQEAVRAIQPVLQSQPPKATKNNNNINPRKERQRRQKQRRFLKQWWAVVQQCLHALCGLVETNPMAVKNLLARTTTTTTAPSNRTVAPTLFMQLLEQCQNALVKVHQEQEQESAAATASDQTSSSKNNNNNNTISNDNSAYVSTVQDVMIYTARTFHSALDDNVDFFKSVPDAAWPFLTTSLQEVDATLMPMAARLHMAGCLVSARGILANSLQQDGSSIVTTSATDFDGVLQTTVVPLLASNLSEWAFTQSVQHQQCLVQFMTALQQYETEQQDDALEKEIIRKVNDRKEPARLIARRQKAMRDAEKKKKEEHASEQQEKDVEMDENRNNSDKDVTMSSTTAKAKSTKDDDETKQTKKEDRTNWREALAKAQEEWNESLVSIQLSLEITANLTSMIGGAAAGMLVEEDYDYMMVDDEDEADAWGPDQEASLMEHQGQQGGGSGQSYDSLSDSDKALVDAIVVRSRMPLKLLELLEACSGPLTGLDTTTSSSVPGDVIHQIQELQEKCGACLGNCLSESFLASHHRDAPTNQPIASLLWTKLCGMLVQGCSTNGSTSAAMTTTTKIHEASIVSRVMVIMIQTQSVVRKQVQPEQLDMLLNLGSKGDDELFKVQCHVVELLGTLCSQETHTEVVNRKVCSKLVSLPPTTPGNENSKTTPSQCLEMMHSVLNALMDIYGDDECHPNVFVDLHVLGYFQRTLPDLKKLLKQEKKKNKARAKTESDDGATEAELALWQETALNAGRFVQYKKGQLHHL